MYGKNRMKGLLYYFIELLTNKIGIQILSLIKISNLKFNLGE